MKSLEKIKGTVLTKQELKELNGGSPPELFYICTYAKGTATIIGVTSMGQLAAYVDNNNAACLAGEEIVGCRHVSDYV